MTWKNRIRRRLELLDKSPRAASIEAGLNTHFLQGVLSNDERSITIDNLLKLAIVLETSPEWILVGRGPDDLPAGASEMLDYYVRLPESERALLLDLARWRMSHHE